MSYSITVELKFFLISVLSGGIILLVYDCLRILRRIIKHDSFFIAVEDLIFWVAAGLFIFTIMYSENDGIIRGFAIMGMAIGMVLYHYIISEHLVRVITDIIKTLLRPFSIAINGVKRFILLLFSKGKKYIDLLIRQLKKHMKSFRIILNKRKQKLAVKRQLNVEKRARKKSKKAEEKSKITKDKQIKRQKSAGKGRIDKEKAYSKIAKASPKNDRLISVRTGK
jgi:spore cortex biosynthesis protein YabQ